MSELHIYTDFNKWFDVVADIDPLSLDAPYRFTIGAYRLKRRGQSIGDVYEWVRAHAKADVHCLEPCESPLEDEYDIVFEDILDAELFRSKWGRCDVDSFTTEDRLMVQHGAAMMRRVRRGR